MTFKDIYKRLCECAIIDGSPLADKVKIVLENELKDKVIIKKGDTIQAQFMGEWDDVFTMSHNREYRIKPKEPVYEWKWSYTFNSGVVAITKEFMTDEEAKQYDTPFEKLEETKRERK